MKNGIVRQTHDEWYTEMLQVYGNLNKATFECPACGHLQSIEDFLVLGIDSTRAYQDCLGRYVNEKGCSFSVDYDDCSPKKIRVIVTGNGHEIKVFNFI
ncbi:hypothetical protein C1X05_00200 [Laceyella sacchari]|uniref:VVA0879 family protein n=1 Tax=Laceyella tengchongensis TaxID=574699 RepID=UPI000C9ED4F2|nr:hypothetical protein C1X05_00200 [Laceyella sacchari]MRG28806.1 hypothetical protein [Laceyella tengchongensis]